MTRLLKGRDTNPKTYYARGEMSPSRPQTSDKMKNELDGVPIWSRPKGNDPVEEGGRDGGSGSHGLLSNDVFPYVPTFKGDDDWCRKRPPPHDSLSPGSEALGSSGWTFSPLSS